MTIEFRLSLGSYASIADTCYVWSCGCLLGCVVVWLCGCLVVRLFGE